MFKDVFGFYRGKWNCPKSNLIFIVILILVPLFYLIPAYIKYGCFSQNDVYIPLKFYLLNAIKNPDYLHWTPNILGGIPFWSNIQNIISPFDVFFFIFPFKSTFNFILILIVILTGVFSYFYLKNLALSNVSCLFGALVYQLSGFSLINIWVGHEDRVMVFMWLPLLLLNLDLYLRSRKSKYLFFTTIIFLFQLFIGYIQSVLIVTLFYYAYLFFRTKIFSKQDWLIKFKSIINITIALLIAVGLSMIKYFPAFNLVKHTDIAKGIDLDFFLSYSMPIVNVFTFVFPKIFGDSHSYWGNIFGYQQYGSYHEFVLYVGLITLIVSTISFLSNKSKFLRFILICFIVTIILSFGKFGYVYYIFRYIPFFKDFRGSNKFLILVPLYFSIFSSHGIDFLYKNTICKKFIKKIVITLTSILLLITFIYIFLIFYEDFTVNKLVSLVTNLLKNSNYWGLKSTDLTDFFKTKVVSSIRSSFGYSIIMMFVTLVLFSSFYLKKIGRKIFILGSLIFLIFDLIYLTLPNFYNINNKTAFNSLFSNNEITQILKDDKSIYRIQAASYEATSYLNLNKSLIFNFEDINGYNLFTLKRYMEFIRAVNQQSMDNYSHYDYLIYNFDSRLINLLNVKYVLSEKDITSNRFKLILDGQVKLYQNTEYLPRFFDLYNFKVMNNPIERFNYLSSQKFDPAKEAILEENIYDINIDPENRIGSADIVVTEYKPNYIKLKIFAKEDFILGSSVVFYPEWKAYLDGKLTKTYCFDHAFQAFVIKSGTHTFELKYIPTSFYIGMTISIISFVILIFYFLTIRYIKFFII